MQEDSVCKVQVQCHVYGMGMYNYMYVGKNQAAQSSLCTHPTQTESYKLIA